MRDKEAVPHHHGISKPKQNEATPKAHRQRQSLPRGSKRKHTEDQQDEDIIVVQPVAAERAKKRSWAEADLSSEDELGENEVSIITNRVGHSRDSSKKIKLPDVPPAYTSPLKPTNGHPGDHVSSEVEVNKSVRSSERQRKQSYRNAMEVADSVATLSSPTTRSTKIMAVPASLTKTPQSSKSISAARSGGARKEQKNKDLEIKYAEQAKKVGTGDAPEAGGLILPNTLTPTRALRSTRAGTTTGLKKDTKASSKPISSTRPGRAKPVDSVTADQDQTSKVAEPSSTKRSSRAKPPPNDSAHRRSSPELAESPSMLHSVQSKVVDSPVVDKEKLLEAPALAPLKRSMRTKATKASARSTVTSSVALKSNGTAHSIKNTRNTESLGPGGCSIALGSSPARGAAVNLESQFDGIPARPSKWSKSTKISQRQQRLESPPTTISTVIPFATPLKVRGRLPRDDINVLSPPKAAASKAIAPQASEPGQVVSLEESFLHLESLLKDPMYEQPLSTLKHEILKGLTGKKRLPMVGFDVEYQKTKQVVEQTVLAGEGNSMLVIGARGSGKTMLVDKIISELMVNHADDFHVIRLNGFLHTDDKLALKDIWRQLGREMELEDGMKGLPNSYADALTSLLALLSHPAELSATDLEADHAARSVIFIIDEFDLFTNHPRQTLLYNLFDIAQSRKAPIAVLGLTTKVGVVESLEKRVKSRFSHRYVHLSLPKSFDTFRDICTSALSCQSTNASLPDDVALSKYLQKADAPTQKLYKAWNEYVFTFLRNDSMMSLLLRQIYARTKSIPTVLTACLLPMISFSPSHIPAGADFVSQALLPPDSKLHILPGLSDLELSLLIAAARLDIILDSDTCNFNMAYDEYTSLAERAKLLSSASGAAAFGGGARVWGREVAMGAWERLEALDLLVPALGPGTSGGMAGAGRGGKLWKVDIALEEIGESGLEMSSTMLKWCKEI